MLSPRHLLILLGFFAQSLTWDSYGLLAATFALWFVCLKWLRGKVEFSSRTEGLLLLLGCALSITVSKLLNRSFHFFLGDGLILLQLARLLRPLNKREKLTSIIIAAFHFGVLCTLAPNIRFVLLYVGALFFVPGALKEIFTQAEPVTPNLAFPRDFRLLPSARVCFWLLLGSAVVFLTFPRFTGTPLQLRESMGEQGSLLDSILDPRNSGRANSQQVLLQIEGDSIRYLRCLSLTEFDGVKWWANRKSPLRRFPYISEEDKKSPHFRQRVVYVKNSQYLGRVLPVDGKVVWMDGNFMSRPLSNPQGNIEVTSMWTTGNNIYEYWIDTDPAPERLSPEMRRQLTYHPKQSEALNLWVENKTEGATNLLQKARLIEKELRENFAYEIGTPELSRLAPVDDFIFNRRAGHCERFAASLALMLRMQGIPARVAIGYVATTRNLFNGRAQVRFRDAHSWTEAYFDKVGWVTLDATPGPTPNSGGADLMDFIDAMDFAWYSHIVNFNGFAQKELLANTRQVLANVPAQAWNGFAWIFGGLVVLFSMVRLSRGKLTIPAFRFNWKKPFSKPTRETVARHSYDRMLRILEKRGLKKKPEITPFEFLSEVNQNGAIPEVEIVTRHFCETFYGEKPGNSHAREEVDSALKALAREK